MGELRTDIVNGFGLCQVRRGYTPQAVLFLAARKANCGWSFLEGGARPPWEGSPRCPSDSLHFKRAS
jgi:hypothetical protein